MDIANLSRSSEINSQLNAISAALVCIHSLMSCDGVHPDDFELMDAHNHMSLGLNRCNMMDEIRDSLINVLNVKKELLYKEVLDL